MKQPPRRIAHLDMDAFYASVDLLRYPELRGLPVVIGGRRSQQPVVMADGGWQSPLCTLARLCALREPSRKAVVAAMWDYFRGSLVSFSAQSATIYL